MRHLAIWLVIGLGAGWLARSAMRSHREHGLLGDLTTGCLGAVVGGWMMRKLDVLAPDNLLGQVFTALIGAVVLLLVIRGLRFALPAVGFAPSVALTPRTMDFETQIRQSTEFERSLLSRFLGRASAIADPNQAFDTQLTFGERVADKVASFGGSWTFIGLFFIAMISGIVLNEEMPKPYDPFPFILLNLVLSCLAAIQAPIIMMSQIRQSEKDRMNASLDYDVNLRAEVEIMALHAKLDAARAEDLTRLAAQFDEQAALLQRIEARLRTGSSLP